MQELALQVNAGGASNTFQSQIDTINSEITTINAEIAAISSTPSGGIILAGTTTAPSGYLICNGQAVSRTTFATLFAVISTKFGAGNGTTTFNVPQLNDTYVKGTEFGVNVGVTGLVPGAGVSTDNFIYLAFFIKT